MILRGTVFSSVLETDTGIAVVVPNKFEPGKPFRTAYLLHGLCGDHNAYLDNTMLPVYANDYDAVIILPQAGRSFYTDMAVGQKYFTYVADELPRIVRSVFHISARREDTAVIGGSMGGYGALQCALRRPGQYGFCCASASPELFSQALLAPLRERGSLEGFRKAVGEQLAEDMRAALGDGFAYRPELEVRALIDQGAGLAEGIKFYLSCGKNDPYFKYHRALGEHMTAAGYDVTRADPEGCHDWAFFDKVLRASLQFCFGEALSGKAP